VLRERREDIPLLAEHFLEELNAGSGQPRKSSEILVKWRGPEGTRGRRLEVHDEARVCRPA
jgi:hypothetical protein